MVEVAKKYFELKEDNRLKIIIEDGYKFILQLGEKIKNEKSNLIYHCYLKFINYR